MTDDTDTGPAVAASDEPYRVLARKYRPKDFDTLIGQDALVRTLTNAIETGRVAQAFMLTGVRGVGKTTTARIIAKALNCIGPDGAGNATAQPCGVCDNCVAIAADRHVDVMEMDAASRTGVDGIRELIDSVPYRPVQARFKVYILDEVHMLSTAAFNALLKTLEEPPEHVKFIFATTEIRKVPVTVLSRCQRFDLRRVALDVLGAHFKSIAEQESATVEDDALAMIARAADGSVRDGLSILDQAIALSNGTVTGERVRDMLGLADRSQIFDLFESSMKGEAPLALDIARSLYNAGADPVVVVQDMLDICYWVTRARLTPELAQAASTPELERTRGDAMAKALSMPSLTRSWQMLLKGLGEVQSAPNPIQALEMLLIRLSHAADLPPPGDIVAKLKDGSGTVASGGASAPAAPAPVGATASLPADNTIAFPAPVPASGEPSVAPAGPPEPDAMPESFEAMVALVEKYREGRLQTHLVHDVHPVAFEPGRIDLRPTSRAPRDLCNRLAGLLEKWTGSQWVVTVSKEPGRPTLGEQRAADDRSRLDSAAEDPLVKSVLAAFPGARIKSVTQPVHEDSDDMANGPTGDVMPDTDDIEEGQTQ